MRTSVGCALALATALLFNVACGSDPGAGGDPDSGTNNNQNNNNQVAQCGNDVQEVGEDCDGSDLAGATCASLSLGTGEVTCTAGCAFDVSDCSEPAECGNGEIEYPETCDGSALAAQTCEGLGFAGGTLACTGDCDLDTSECLTCGNDVIDGAEQCDGASLNGQDCASLGLGSGTLDCTAECVFDTAGCAVQPTCGDDTAQGAELCDGIDLRSQDCASLGYGTGTLACTGTCTWDLAGCQWCGNGAVDGAEDCEGTDLNSGTCVSEGFADGTLACTGSCTYDTSGCTMCGNGAIDTGEQCDGAALGGQDCTDHGFAGGTLACTSACQFDTSACENCGSSDTTAPVASNHVPAPETLGAPRDTVIAVDLTDECGIDTGAISMRITIEPKFGPAQVLSVTPTITGSGNSVTATYTHPTDYPWGAIVTVLLSAQDVNTNNLSETWRFSVRDQMFLYTGGSGGIPLVGGIDEANPNTPLPGANSLLPVGGAAGSEMRAVLLFMPSVPTGPIFSARLDLGICPPGPPASAVTVDCYRLNAASTPHQATWLSRMTAPTTAAWGVAGANGVPADRQGTAAANVPVPATTPSYSYVSDDALDLVLEWQGGAAYEGLLCATTSTDAVPLCGPFSNAAPRIEIIYGPELP